MDPLTPNRDRYEGMRDKSNQAFIRASYCTMVVLANHVLSAFDAAFTIGRKNRAVESRMRMTAALDRQRRPLPVLCLTLGW